MDKKENGGPAFPVAFTTTPLTGMTLRDYFAATALLAIRSKSTSFTPSEIAGQAYGQADAMLQERAE